MKSPPLWHVHGTFITLSTQCHWVMQQGLPVVLLLCIQKWVFPAEISSLEKDGFGNSSIAATSATQRGGVAQLSQHRLAPALKEVFTPAGETLKRACIAFFKRVSRWIIILGWILVFPMSTVTFESHQEGSCGSTVKMFMFSEGAAHPDNSPVHPPNTVLALWLALEDWFLMPPTAVASPWQSQLVTYW